MSWDPIGSQLFRIQMRQLEVRRAASELPHPATPGGVADNDKSMYEG